MQKREYFLAALHAGAYKHKDWILNAFSITDATQSHHSDIPYLLYRDDKGNYVFKHQGKEEILEGTNLNDPPFSFHEKVELKKGDLPNVGKPIHTTYGNMLFNAIAVIYPFGDKVPYMEGRVSVKEIEKIIMAKLTDHPTKPDDITVAEYLKFGEAMYSLVGLTQLCVPSATPKTMTADPKMAELKAKLLAENKGHLDDPVVIAKIEKALVDMDKAWIKGDPAEGFYVKDKSYSIIRKQLFGMYGAEDPFGTGVTVNLVEKSLNDGWDINNLPMLISTLREGSFMRGHQTELGGAIAKEINRYCTNSSISEEDCGAKIGLPTLITKENKKDYLNNYIFVNGKEILTDESNINSLVGKTVDVRSPIYCQTKGIDYCRHCSGKEISETPNAIGSYIADIGQAFLLTSMKAMHGRVLATNPWSLDELV